MQRPARRYESTRHSRRSIALVGLYLLVSVIIATGASWWAHRLSSATAPTQNLAQVPFSVTVPKYLVLMVLDGGRPDYFTMAPLPHIDALAQQGTQYTQAFDGILESETPAGHTTISTGSPPSANGILGFDWATGTSRFSLFDPTVVDAGAMEHIMEQAHVSTIAGLYKKAHPGATVVALSGHKYYAADPLGGPDADAIMYYQGSATGTYVPVAIPGHQPPAGILTDPALIAPTTHLSLGQEDDLATKLAITTFQRMHQRLTLINFPEFDWPLGHVDGGNLDPKDVITLMKGVDNDIGRIEDAYRQAGVLDQTLFVITADHGMGPITRFIPSTVVSDAVAKAGTTAPDIAANTADYVWLADPTKAQAVADNVAKSLDPGIQSVYYLASGPGGPHYVLDPNLTLDPSADRANQYLLSTLINGKEPAVVVFTNEGATFSSSTSNWKADHGGNGWQAQHIPLILSGPGINAAVVTDKPAQLEDIAPTVLADMGVTPVGMEGKVLAEALTNPSAAQKAARQAEIASVQPVVAGLAAQEKSTTVQTDVP